MELLSSWPCLRALIERVSPACANEWIKRKGQSLGMLEALAHCSPPDRRNNDTHHPGVLRGTCTQPHSEQSCIVVTINSFSVMLTGGDPSNSSDAVVVAPAASFWL